jgi:hypothetical protein
MVLLFFEILAAQSPWNCWISPIKTRVFSGLLDRNTNLLLQLENRGIGKNIYDDFAVFQKSTQHSRWRFRKCICIIPFFSVFLGFDSNTILALKTL